MIDVVIETAIEGIGLIAPGLPDWAQSRGTLAGVDAYVASESVRPLPTLLAPNERRRAPESVLLAFAAAEQACTMAQRAPRDLPNVFASAYGDLVINDYLCTVLARAPLELSPTKFHNSVHNAAAGYWTIATGCMASSTALSAGAATFGAGLYEAALFAHSEASAVLYCAYDVAVVGALKDSNPSHQPFAVAFVLAPQTKSAAPRLRLKYTDDAESELALQSSALHALQINNPIASSLPLLSLLAQNQSGVVGLPAAHGESDCTGRARHLRVEIKF